MEIITNELPIQKNQKVETPKNFPIMIFIRDVFVSKNRMVFVDVSLLTTSCESMRTNKKPNNKTSNLVADVKSFVPAPKLTKFFETNELIK